MSEKLPESTFAEKKNEKKDVDKHRPEKLRKSFKEAFGTLVDTVNLPNDSFTEEE